MRWEGRCPTCQSWNSLSEVRAEGSAGGSTRAASLELHDPSPLLGSSVSADREADRIASGIGVVDRVLGGGFVPGSVILLGGAPGIGKSTLLLQLAACVDERGGSVLYASGEESHGQVALRASRLGGGAGRVAFIATDRMDAALAAAAARTPDLLCLDSVQTLAADGAGSAGGVAQVRASAAAAHEFAKRTGTVVVLVGHVTKGGGLAGPRSLEHLVDVVLHFEGQRSGEYRMLRGSKNRFGATDELAAFRMRETGLEPVADPEGLFLGDRPAESSGSAVAAALHGTRPLLTEIQALTTPARYGAPQRVTTGFPPRRLAILLAVLQRHAGVPLGDTDVFLSVVGGARLTDPGADLAVCAALASSHLDRPLGRRSAFIGEVGLDGGLRRVARIEERVQAAVRAGFDDVVVPAAHAASLEADCSVAEGVGAVVDGLRA